jgi:hypothetical protein
MKAGVNTPGNDSKSGGGSRFDGLECALLFANLCFAGQVAIFAAFSRFAVDDFCVTGMVSRLGFWNAQAHWYLKWIGRWMATLNESVFGWLSASSGKSTAVVLIGVALNWTAIAYLCRVIFLRRGVERAGTRAWNWAGLALGLLFLATPNPSQSWYWLSGTITYAWPLAGIFAAVAYVLDPRPVSLLRRIGFFFVGAAVGGSNEAVAGVLILLLVLGWLWTRFREKNPTRANRLLWPLLGTLLSFAVVVAAPGNAIRRSELAIVPGANPLPFFDAILQSFPNAFSILEAFWRHKKAWLLIGCAAMLALPGKPSIVPRAGIGRGLLLGLATLVLVWVGNAVLVFPGALVIGSNLPDRVWISNSLWTMAIGAWGFALALRSSALYPNLARDFSAIGRKVLVLAILGVAVYNLRFTYRRWQDIRAYAQAYDTDYRRILTARDSGLREPLTVAPLPFTNEYFRMESLADGCLAEMLQLKFPVVVDPR